MRGLTIAEIRFTTALITEADATATAIAAVHGDGVTSVQALRATRNWLRAVRDTGVLASDSKTVSETVALPAAPWPCGHRELTPGCDRCGDVTAAWWAETKRRTAESHGKTVAEFYGVNPCCDHRGHRELGEAPGHEYPCRVKGCQATAN